MLIGYCRVSSESERQSLDLQKDALLKAGVDRRNIFEDRSSGSKGTRPGLSKALDFLHEGDVLVVWKLDRLGRSLSHLIEILNQLKRRGIAFLSLTDNIDTSTPSGSFFFHVFGALAQFERELIRERVNAGLEAARTRGRIGGRPRAIGEEKMTAIIDSLNNGSSKSAGLSHL